MEKQKTILKMRMVEFGDYGEEEFLEYLLLQEAEELQLQLPKHTVLYQSSHRQFVAEYARMALLGEKLAALGPGFWWFAPPVPDEGVFLFFVPLTNRAALASVLVMARDICRAGIVRDVSYDYEAAQGVENFDGSPHPCYDYWVLASQFWMMGDKEFGVQDC